MGLNEILGEIRFELKRKEKIRERAQEVMRKATRLSKEAILLIHKKGFREARKRLTRARKMIRSLNTLSEGYPEIVYTGLFDAALQEYCEASILFQLVRNGTYVSPDELEVPHVAYILGLADVIGELRRSALDALREGNVENAEKCLEKMEEIYSSLMAMDEAYLLVPGLRRKCDVARRIIETTRGDVTLESRRASLEKAIRDFEKLVEKSGKRVKGKSE
ncbi:MAG TPA: haloacid dehalogenase [Candidatus Bathyarchaeota archaeon]|nr:haloacid dehalogenase [Candidatus Bathyarchaeota archaeon]